MTHAWQRRNSDHVLLFGTAINTAFAALTTLADFIGPGALFPMRLSVRIVTTLIGGPHFLWLMRKQGR